MRWAGPSLPFAGLVVALAALSSACGEANEPAARPNEASPPVSTRTAAAEESDGAKLVSLDDPAAGISIRYPAGWDATTRPLTVVAWPPQRLAIASYPLPGGELDRDCAPVTAIEAMPPDGVFVFLFEYTQPDPAGEVGGVPRVAPRPDRFQLEEQAFARYECFGESYLIRFSDRGWAFQAHILFGAEAGERRRTEALAVLESLRVEPIPGSAAGPTGKLFLRNVWEQSLTVVDIGTGRATTVDLPELAPGDPPFSLVQTGGKLVFYGRSATFALDPELESPPRSLGESWYFVPSAQEGRVWLALLDPKSPDTVRALRGVREVTVDGEVTIPDSGPPPSPNLLGALGDGLLFQDDDGLQVWDPRTGQVKLRLHGPFPADTHGELVAWCEYGCPALHLTNVRTGEDRAIAPAEPFAFEETYDGAFSPDGSLLAVPVVTEGEQRHRVALIDVRAGVASVIEGSELADYRAMAWSRSGEWLFFSAGDGRIMAYRPGAERAVVLPVRVEQSFADMAAN